MDMYWLRLRLECSRGETDGHWFLERATVFHAKVATAWWGMHAATFGCKPPAGWSRSSSQNSNDGGCIRKAPCNSGISTCLMARSLEMRTTNQLLNQKM